MLGPKPPSAVDMTGGGGFGGEELDGRDDRWGLVVLKQELKDIWMGRQVWKLQER